VVQGRVWQIKKAHKRIKLSGISKLLKVRDVVMDQPDDSGDDGWDTITPPPEDAPIVVK
jgi:hypothetical protein